MNNTKGEPTTKETTDHIMRKENLKQRQDNECPDVASCILSRAPRHIPTQYAPDHKIDAEEEQKQNNSKNTELTFCGPAVACRNRQSYQFLSE
uniref:Uncharacterized protein n=1 Tax=Arundo donax TaxID=35708 RepID=A0A0A9GAQ2_ARUDO